MINNLIDFYLKSNPATIGVLLVLSVYFVILNWIFFYRYFSLNSWLSIENNSLESLLMGATTVSSQSFLRGFLKSNANNPKEILDLAMLAATKEATKK